ncbi:MULTISPECIES: GNAT family N-acetyltransferase [Aeromonas]|uniref:GNAT family N-acetyltransferase n=1 Tax=Aeromonas TaxID=642 RepID=UPI001378F342|nr:MULTISPECIES: GNAT family N-acetyltransferase [Aeromonas]MBS4709786.1 GNAT family N-acetyltransferase [Aeromonas caviae]MDX7692325.1 GNAT family N-acetyltransferase [Aeromonas caviae]NBA24199.1 GNAT family N-acetyltransferase [Aeromonas caviae]
MLVKKYSNADKKIWDEFVFLAKNKHFFFFRDFMEYHSDRFNDHSLMFFDDSQKLLAILPANHADGKLHSHQGLTFGGIIIKSSAKQKEINAIFDAIPEYLKKNGFSSLIYKKIPYIYHSFPCDEDLYSLFRLNSNVVRRDVSSTIKMNNQIKYSKGRKWIVKKSNACGVVYKESDDISAFWSNLTEVLMAGHGAKPVHSYDEIAALKKTFPENIKVFSALRDGEQVAGAVMFITETVAHTQYLYNTVAGRDVGALDGLVDYLVKTVFVDKEYFDFGISNEQQGRYLNEGLISQKEGFGARAVVHDFYEIKAND